MTSNAEYTRVSATSIGLHVSTPKTSLTALELDRVLTLVALEAKSDPGRQAILRRQPLPTIEACERAQANLADMVRFSLTEGLLPLAGLTDVSPFFARESVLELKDSWLVVRAVRATQAMRETFLRVDTYPRLTAIARNISDLGDLITKTNKYFTRDGKLREDASSELRSIRTRVHQKRTAIQRVLNEVMNRNGDAIQEPIIVQRGDRYCVPVRSDHRNSVPGILHERSGSGASFFIEPMASVELNNDLADLLMQEREEIARITRAIAQLLADQATAINVAVEVAGDFDCLQACAIFHRTIDGTRPAFSADRRLHVLDGRHPLVDERLMQARAEAFAEESSDQTVVPITIALDSDVPALVVSGPNAGGKTVALKTAGLLVAMAMSGLPVPAADGTVIPFVDALHVLIGDDQSVLEHLSTFSAYLVRLKRVLDHATERSLVLLDELGSGTDPEEGAALAAAVVEHLLATGTLLIATTHLSALKTFAVDDARIVNASMQFDSATGHPTYRMITGIPGRSRAIDVAQMIGLPAKVIASARERLGDRYGETDSLLSQLQTRMADVLRQVDELTRARRDSETERARLADATEKFEKERTRAGAAFREELERLRDDVSRQVTNELRHLRELDRNARSSVNAAEVAKSVTQVIDRAIEFLPAEHREISVGDRVEHRKFKVTGAVVSIAGGKAVLNVNGRKMTVESRDLAPLSSPKQEAGKKSKYAAAQPSHGDDAVEISAELNLIGQRVDDALDESDKFLDRSLLEGRQAVRIIHGFGTGRLRSAIREHLRKHPAVKSFRPGDDKEGGDGATIAVLS
jgi:DNA mismatch repair protein MutS2